jgi:hypothetical protein
LTVKGHIEIKIEILGFECQASGTYTKRAKQATKIDNAAACLCFLNYLAFLRPAADRAVPISLGCTPRLLIRVSLGKGTYHGEKFPAKMPSTTKEN